MSINGVQTAFVGWNELKYGTFNLGEECEVIAESGEGSANNFCNIELIADLIENFKFSGT